MNNNQIIKFPNCIFIQKRHLKRRDKGECVYMCGVSMCGFYSPAFIHRKLQKIHLTKVCACVYLQEIPLLIELNKTHEISMKSKSRQFGLNQYKCYIRVQ